MSITLYGANVSPFVRKVRVVLTEKGLEYAHDPVNPFDPPPDYRNISPLGKIPALVVDGHTLADSSVICFYIERTHPNPPLYPAEPYPQARAMWIEEFIDSGFMPVAGAEVFRPLVLAPIMMKQPVTDEIRAAVETAVTEKVSPMWSYLEGELAGQDYFVGDTMTIADIAVASAHVNLHHAGVAPDAGQFPHLAGLLERMFARPIFKALIEEESPVWGQRAA